MFREIPVYFISLGCPKTRVDTENLMGRLGRVRPVATPAEAELIFVNTCGFIAPASEESVRTILEMSREAASAPRRPLLAVAGCLVSRYGSEITAELPEVDLWLPLDKMEHWPALVAGALGRSELPEFGAGSRALSTPPGYAYLKISEGCDRSCAFCTIPSIRGPQVSRPIAELAAEARALTARGVKELVVVGQDVTAYGRDLAKGEDLEHLVEALAATPGLARLRLMYLYPKGLDARLLDFLAGLGEPFVPYFDIPLQHSHPEVLRRMGRPFTREPAATVAAIREKFPDAAIRTTLIVGFPGETRARFNHLTRFVRETRFDHLGLFAFCPEDGTPAAKEKDRVTAKTADKRRNEVLALQAEISAGLLERYVGQRLEVLVDEESPEWPGLYIGRTWFQAPEVDGVAYVSGPDAAPGQLVTCEVVESKTYDIVGLV